jgi:hypothetical protein
MTLACGGKHVPVSGAGGESGRAIRMPEVDPVPSTVAAVDFRRFTYVWCKDNPAGNVGDTSERLAFVRLSRECLAAKGEAFGTGYIER